jgi:zinc transport system substrate-binding protein
VLVSGCSGEPAAAPSAEPSESTPRLGADLDVVAAVYPLAWVAGEVAPYADLELLNQGGQDAHDLDLSPLQRAEVQTADVVLYVGPLDYQPQVEVAVEAAEGEVVDASEAAGEAALLLASESGDAHGPEDVDEDEPEDAPTDEQAEPTASPAPDASTPPSASTSPTAGTEGTEGEETGEETGDERIDPHLWFSPSIMARVAVATGEAFAEADPDNAEGYRTSAARVRDDLMALGAEVEVLLGEEECLFEEAVVSHAAYGYLLDPYGKRQHPLTGVGAEGDASAGELAEVVREIRDQGFRYVLAEPVEGRAGAEAVAQEAGVELLEISPLDAVSEEQAARGLPALVLAQARRFSIALGCT